MKPKPKQYNLEHLMANAADYARQYLRSEGSVAPALFLAVPDGLLVLRFAPPAGISDKNDMAKFARLACLAFPATAAVLVAEAWMVSEKPGRPLDPAIAPSTYPDRQEVVYLSCESTNRKLTRHFPILRKPRGGFLRLGPPKTSSSEFEGRMSQLMPAKVPTPQARAQAMRKLEALKADSSPKRKAKTVGFQNK